MGLYSSESCTKDSLLAGTNDNYASKGITILSGAGVLARGTVLGKITKAAGEAVKGAGNTGTATIGAVTLLAGAKVGTYKLACISVANHVGTFSVIDPDGYRLADAVQGVAYADDIAFTIAVVGAGTDTVVGDTFTIPVAAGSGKYKIVNSASVDGSQDAVGILCEDINATSADVVTAAYIRGEFNERELTFGGTDTADTHRAALEARGIILRGSVPA